MSSSCSICSEVYDDDVSASHCGHVFHTRCIGAWLQQKRSCPLCKAHISSTQMLTQLRFSPKRKLCLLQESSSSGSTDSASPFTLSIRLQALQQQQEDIKLRILQLSTSCSSLRTAVTSLQSSLSAATQRRSQLEQQLQSLGDGLLPLEQDVASRKTQWRRLQRVHDWKWRHLLVIRGMRSVKRDWRSGKPRGGRDRDRDRGRETTATEAKVEDSRRGGAGDSSDDDDDAESGARWFVDVERVVLQEEARMPLRRLAAADCEAEDEDERRHCQPLSTAEPADARREAMDLLLRVLLSEVQAELEAAKREYQETVQDRREAARKMRREEAAVTTERRRARERKEALLQERMTLHEQKQKGRKAETAQGGKPQQPQQLQGTQRDAEGCSAVDDSDVIVLSG